MTLMYKIVPPHIYISLCVFAWGLLASLQSIASSFVFLLIIRAFLGVAEAAFGPGVPFYLSFFYKRSELAYRVGLFIAAAPLATSFASSLAWVIVRLSKGGPVAPWRALFLVEGLYDPVVHPNPISQSLRVPQHHHSLICVLLDSRLPVPRHLPDPSRTMDSNPASQLRYRH